MPAYAGIGSRETPANVRALMSEIAWDLAEAGYTLRSGAADGADKAFEDGLAPRHLREIYLPWPGAFGHQSVLNRPSREAMELAATLHPAWDRCGQGAKKLHARNMHQVLGQRLNAPVDFVVCFTKGGTGAGGTGQAIRLAQARGIPIFDLGKGLHVANELRDFVRELQKEHGLRP